MKNTKKIYIGKGNQVKDFDLLTMVINVDAIKDLTFKGKNGDTLLKLNIARTKEPDQYGRTHTAYVTVNAEPQAQEPAPRKGKKAKAATSASQDDDRPTFKNH